jgi:PAS domain S-box-containing protein
MQPRLSNRYALVIVSLVLIVVVTLSGLYLFIFDKASQQNCQESTKVLSAALKEQLRKRGYSLAAQLCAALINPTREMDMGAINKLIEPVFQQPDIVAAQVLNPSGLVMNHGNSSNRGPGQKVSLPVIDAALQKKSMTHVFKKDLLNVACPIIMADDLLGAVFLSFSLADIQKTIKVTVLRMDDLSLHRKREFVIIALWSTLFLGLVAVTTSALIARNMAKPIKQLSNAAYWIGQGEYDLLVENERHDELGALVESFKRMAAELKETTVSKDFFYNIINSMSDTLIVLNPDHSIAMANLALSDLAGHKPDDIIGRNVCIIFGGSDEQLPNWLSISNGDHEPVFGYDTKLINAQANEIPVRVSTAAMHDAGGELEAIICLVSNLTELKQAQDEKQHLQLQLEHAQRLQAIGTLVAGISHDFNNLLQVIGNYLIMIAKRDLPEEQTQEYIKEAGKSIDRATELVKRLLTFSRKVEPEMKKMDLNRAVIQTVEVLRHTLSPMIHIRTELDSDLKGIWADGQQIESILLNMASNAMDAMPGGGELIFITRNEEVYNSYSDTAKDCRPGEYICLSIRDTGHGMGSDTLAHIFEPFFTTKKLGEGTGLGLSAVYGIVQAHHGHIKAESAPELGTRFDIYLPVEPSPQNDVECIPEPEASVERLREGLILLVDDEPAIRDITSIALEEQGFSTLTASSGEDALEMHENSDEPIDLVVLDLGMPGMGGQACLKELLRRDPKTKVIIASGYTGETNAQNLLEMGARAVMKKPYKLNELYEKVDQVLAGLN